jgi:hypothetical protein
MLRPDEVCEYWNLTVAFGRAAGQNEGSGQEPIGGSRCEVVGGEPAHREYANAKFDRTNVQSPCSLMGDHIFGSASAGATWTSAAAVRSFFVAAAFLATALPFFFAAFLPADFNLRARIAFFVVALRFLGMGIPL